MFLGIDVRHVQRPRASVAQPLRGVARGKDIHLIDGGEGGGVNEQLPCEWTPSLRVLHHVFLFCVLLFNVENVFF